MIAGFKFFSTWATMCFVASFMYRIQADIVFAVLMTIASGSATVAVCLIFEHKWRSVGLNDKTSDLEVISRRKDEIKSDSVRMRGADQFNTPKMPEFLSSSILQSSGGQVRDRFHVFSSNFVSQDQNSR